MNNLKAVLKLVIFLPVTLFLYVIILFSYLLPIIGIPYQKVRSKVLIVWGRWCCFILQMKVEVKGKAPEPPFFLVSNHLSYVDIFLLFSRVKGVFVAKSDVKQWPIIGFIVYSCGILFIDRNRKRDISRVNKLISKNITEHQGVIVFPESRTSPGVKILPFRSSLLEVPVAKKIPVAFAVITYECGEGEEAACRNICWWDDESFLSHFFSLLKMKPFKAVITFGEKQIVSDNRKELTQLLHQEVRKQFKPVISQEVFEKMTAASA